MTAPLLLVHDSLDCSHKFVDSVICLKCGKHCSDLRLEDDRADQERATFERALRVVRFVDRFGEPQTDAGKERVSMLRAIVKAGAP